MSQISPTQDDLAGAPYAAAGPVEAAPRAGLRGILASPYLTLISRLVLGGIFLLAGLTKIGVPAAFAASINSYEMPLPDFLVQVMAGGLPILELGLGVWLLLGLFTRLAAAITGGLMLIFIVALVQAVLRGISPNCGCFGGPDSNALGAAVIQALGPVGDFLTHEKADAVTVGRDVVFLLMAVHLWFVPTVFSLDSLRARRAAEDLAAEEAAAEEMAE